MIRWLLPLAALVSTTAASAASPPAPTELLRTMVEADTTRGTRALAVSLRALLLAQGFAPADAQLLAPSDKPDQANLVVRLHGRGLAPPVLFIGHLDVVPATGQSWTVPPFKLTAKDGFFYGRGTLDMKGEDVAMLLGLIAMKRSGTMPDRDLILALTADEETGAADGVEWLLKAHRSAIDAAFVINPDEGAAGMRDGRRIYYGIQTSTKRYVTYRLDARAPGGHSDLPPARNAVFVLAAALDRLAGYRLPVRITEATRAHFSALADRASGGEASDLRAVLAASPDPAAVDRLSADPEKAAALRSTCAPTMLHASEQENVMPETASATIQCRLLPGDDAEAVRLLLLARAADPSLSLTITEAGLPAPALPIDQQVIARVHAAAQAFWPGLLVTPALNLGSSDSDFTRAAGLPTYGVCSIFYDLDDDRMHAADERISAAAFDEGLRYMAALMQALGRH